MRPTLSFSSWDACSCNLMVLMPFEMVLMPFEMVLTTPRLGMTGDTEF